VKVVTTNIKEEFGMGSYGIDLGTTYSCIARVNAKGEAEVVKNKQGENTTPSLVMFDDAGNAVVGSLAKEQLNMNPDAISQYIKREMGNSTSLSFAGKEYTPEEVSALILKKLVTDANELTGENITDVVITVPAYFGVNERKATENAGKIAGLNVLRIINEPTAAAISYMGLGGEGSKNQSKIIMIYDLGGGTFDVTIAEMTGDDIEVICTDGDHKLGGKDWDELLMGYIVDDFCAQTGIDSDEIYGDAEETGNLVLKVEKAKKALTESEKTDISLKVGKAKATVTITREKFDEITLGKLNSTKVLVKSVIEAANLKTAKKGCPGGNFDEVIMVGGSTRMRQISEMIEKEFGKKPRVLDPDEAVAKGAAILADRILKSPVPEPVAEQQITGAPKQIIRKLAGGDISDVTGKTYGTDAIDANDKNRIANILFKNTVIPSSRTESFVTSVANQKNVSIEIYESSAEEGEAWIDLEQGEKIAEGILSLPDGLPKGSPIEITIHFDESQLITITAIEGTEKRECVITVKAKGLTDEEISVKAKKMAAVTTE
jgi:molecular chaperone DnaK (HSP70)